jgi:hypothetical protein
MLWMYVAIYDLAGVKFNRSMSYRADSTWAASRGVHSLLYFAYTCVRDLFIGGLFTLQKRLSGDGILHVKKPENIICDGILHVNMFHYFRIPYFTCTLPVISPRAALLLYKPDMVSKGQSFRGTRCNIQELVMNSFKSLPSSLGDMEFAAFCSTLVFEPKPCHPHCWVEFYSGDDFNLQQQLVWMLWVLRMTMF